jgi:hypothetical protein
LAIYFFYSRSHSRLGNPRHEAGIAGD